MKSFIKTVISLLVIGASEGKLRPVLTPAVQSTDLVVEGERPRVGSAEC